MKVYIQTTNLTRTSIDIPWTSPTINSSNIDSCLSKYSDYYSVNSVDSDFTRTITRIWTDLNKFIEFDNECAAIPVYYDMNEYFVNNNIKRISTIEVRNI